MNEKIAHLNMIQDVLTRMANYSMLMKVFSLVITLGLIITSSNTVSNAYLFLAYLPCAALWTLDGFFLWQERMYRKLYQAVSKTPNSDINFDMNATKFINEIDEWFSTSFSKTLCLFHGVLFSIVTFGILLGL